MSKYLVETFYTCTFKITHKLDELNEKKLSDLENRKDGKVEIIDVRLNNRKTKTTSKSDYQKQPTEKVPNQNSADISSIINKKFTNSENLNQNIKPDNKNLLSIVNYEDSIKKIVSATNLKHHELLEDLAENIFDIIFENKIVKKVNLKLEKLDIIKNTESVGIEVSKRRDE